MSPEMPNMQPAKPQENQIPFTANEPKGSGTLPRAGQVIKTNVPRRLSGMNIPQPDSQKDFELQQYIAAHKKLVQTTGKLMPMPFARDIKIGNVVIPADLVKHIGEWAVPVVAGPEVFKKPGEEW
jgi:hypothetical protein